MNSDPLHICICENRAEDEVAIKLLIMSLHRHQPDCIIHLFIPGLGPSIRDWVGKYPNVRLEAAEWDPALSWNVKPMLLSRLLQQGLPSVVWLDSDIIVTAPIARFFDGAGDGTLFVAEEIYTRRDRGVAARTRAWGLPAGQELPFKPNSCILRLTKAHMPFLAAWQDLLDRPDYVAAQKSEERPFHMFSDQDAMSALLGSRDFADLDVRPIRQGKDVAQCLVADSYGIGSRLANWRRLPPFVHAQGGSKPWRQFAGARPMFVELSPYLYAARPYRSELSPHERMWLDHGSMLARALHALALGNPNLAGLPPALGMGAAKVRSLIWKRIVHA